MTVSTMRTEASSPTRTTYEAAIGDMLPARARVLLVDDDERNLLAIRTVVEEVADVVVANSGEEALRHLLKAEFAVILLDVYMPGMDGYETAQLIRRREQSRHTPIIFLSAVNKEEAHLIRGYAMGAVDYVFKPVEPVVLRSKVAVFVDLYQKTREIERKAREQERLLDENLRIQSERLKAEQTLRRLEQRQATIVESLPIVLYLEPVDAEPRVPQFVGGKFREITGFDFSELQSRPNLWAERIHQADRERVLAAISERCRTGTMAIEYRWKDAAGNYRSFLEQAVMLRGKDGQPCEFAGSLLDVTERRALENQLVEAQKLDAIGKLTGGIAHDFNNLLAAVLGGLGMIERRCVIDEQAKKIVTMIGHAAEQGTELVRRLLAFARRRADRWARARDPASAAAMKTLMGHTLGGLVTLSWDTAETDWPVLADESQLELALMNLMINARDAMPDGGAIGVATENVTVGPGEDTELPGGDYVLLTIADDGVGIAPDIIDRVFDPFFTTKEMGKGTGLGLSMVYGFAQQSGGTVRITSAPGEGTRVRLWLPRAVGDAAPAVNVRGPAEAQDDCAPSLRILLADDHPQVRLATAAQLEDLGHVVVAVDGSEKALEQLENGEAPIDLILTDYAMPRISGTELIRRARLQRPGLKAILITGYADVEMIINRPRDVSVLLKPFTHFQLREAIVAAAAGRTSARG
jgi:signal transduction histidine kinase